jgi:RNA polymerase sigma-70 factor, ECF subfamily
MLGITFIKAQPTIYPMQYRSREERLAAQFSTQDISGLLQAWHDGDDQALNRLMPLVNDELHRLARCYIRRERRDHLLQSTDLVNEAFIKLVNAKNIDWQSRAHFIAVSAKLMRRILVDYARRSDYIKRGPAFKRTDLTERLPAPSDPNIVALDDALNDLSEVDPQKARVVELKFFGGLTIKETAKELKISQDKVKREWNLAKGWLNCAMTDRGEYGPQSRA